MDDLAEKIEKLKEISLLSKVEGDNPRSIAEQSHLSRLTSEMIIQIHLEAQTYLLQEILQELRKDN